MILLVAGSRSIKSEAVVFDACDKALNIFKRYPDVVISGGAPGVDELGERWALERGIAFVPFFPLWDELGKRAGFLRNKQMARAATHAVIVWDGESRGAKHMRDLAIDYGLELHTEYVKKG